MIDATENISQMIAEDILAQEFTRVVNHYYPKIGQLLDGCHVKVITCFWGRPANKRFQYIGIYCPDDKILHIQAKKVVLREIAENMGLIQVVCLNAKKLLHDPMSSLKKSQPKLWLELQLVAA